MSGNQIPQEDLTPGGAAEASVEDSNVEYKTVDVCLIFGGMDTEGEIFDDCLIYLVT